MRARVVGVAGPCLPCMCVCVCLLFVCVHVHVCVPVRKNGPPNSEAHQRQSSRQGAEQRNSAGIESLLRVVFRVPSSCSQPTLRNAAEARFRIPGFVLCINSASNLCSFLSPHGRRAGDQRMGGLSVPLMVDFSS